LTYALYLLAKHPEIEATCLEEINTVIGTASGDKVSLSDGPEQLPYTRAVILETLRLYPPAPVTARTMEKPITLKNPSVTIEKGQAVMLPIWCIQRYEENYPRPNEIHPERWVRRKETVTGSSSSSSSSAWEERPSVDMESNTTVPPANRDAFCVFAAGARNCVGRVLAMQESVTLLALLLRKLKFELAEKDYEVKPTSCAVVQQPEDSMPMIIKAR
jgi:cytochrome P450